MSSGNVFIDKWAEAIKQHEGWKPGSVSFRNNNPGNLKGNIAGSIKTDKKGFAVFPNVAAGQLALEKDLIYKAHHYKDKTILQIMSRYLGGSFENPQITKEGDPFAYAKFVAKHVGSNINAKLGDLYSGSGGSNVLSSQTIDYAKSLDPIDAEIADPNKPFFEALTAKTRNSILDLNSVIQKLDQQTLRIKLLNHPQLKKLVRI